MIVFAVNVHTGGGAVLLEQLIYSNFFNQKITHLYIDMRFKDENSVLKNRSDIVVFKIQPRLIPRLIAELKLYNLLIKSDIQSNTVLFFGNLPPVFKFYYRFLLLWSHKKNHPPAFWLFMQNALLFKNINFQTNTINFKLRFKLFIERNWLQLFYKNVDKIIVQNKWMLHQSQEHFPNRPSEIHPIPPYIPLTNLQIAQLKYNKTVIHQFIHVGSLHRHKNLSLFIDAVKLLDRQIKPENKIKIAIVLDNTENEFIQRLKNKLDFKNVQIDLFFQIKREEILKLYSSSQYLICTSSFESFYIPMFEAHSLNCKIVAPTWAGYAEDIDFIDTYYDSQIPDLVRFIPQV